MIGKRWNFMVLSLIAALVLAFAWTPVAQAQIVQPSELRDALLKESSTREKNIEQVNSFLDSKPVHEVLTNQGVEVKKLQAAIGTMNSDDLAALAARTQKIQNDFAAGALNNEQLTYIIIALVTAVIILVIIAR